MPNVFGCTETQFGMVPRLVRITGRCPKTWAVKTYLNIQPKAKQYRCKFSRGLKCICGKKGSCMEDHSFWQRVSKTRQLRTTLNEPFQRKTSLCSSGHGYSELRLHGAHMVMWNQWNITLNKFYTPTVIRHVMYDVERRKELREK